VFAPRAQDAQQEWLGRGFTQPACSRARHLLSAVQCTTACCAERSRQRCMASSGPQPCTSRDSCSFVGAEMPRGRRFHWEVVVVEDKTPNAFVLPGGKIVVFTSAPPHAAQALAAPLGSGGHLLPPSTQLGTWCSTPSLREVLLLTRPGSAPSAGLLLPEQQNFLLLLLLLRKCVRRVRAGLIKLLDRDEDLLAAVLGHEVAHALARHSTEKLRCGLGFPRFPQAPCVSTAAGAAGGRA